MSAILKRVPKRLSFKMAHLLNFENWHFGARLFWYPFGCLSGSTQTDIKTDGFETGKFFNLESSILAPVSNRFVLVPVWFPPILDLLHPHRWGSIRGSWLRLALLHQIPCVWPSDSPCQWLPEMGVLRQMRCTLYSHCGQSLRRP